MIRRLVPPFALLLSACLAGAAPLRAQDPLPPRMPVVGDPGGLPGAVDRLPPLTSDGGRLAPRGTLYDVIVASDSGAQHVGWHTVWIHDAVFSGATAWEVLERRESHRPWVVRITRDSAVLRRADLLPLRWEAEAGDARLVAAFANDSAYGGATSRGARATFTIGAPGQVITSEGALDAALQGAPLADGWRASSALLIPDLSGARIVPLELAVTGVATIELPAGRFDTWVVEATAPGASVRTIWVDRRTQLVIRTLEAPVHMPGMRVERVFVGGY